MYYPEIPLMQDTVIYDPQVIFDCISRLIIDRFQYSNRKLKSREIDEFYLNGQFTMAQIKDKTEDYQSIHLSLQQLIETLKHLNVLAEIKNEQQGPEPEAASSQSPPTFILPAVLKQASEEELSTPPSDGLTNLVCPLMIHFDGGFVPFGVFCASIAHLIAHQNSMTLKWQLCDGKVMKNKVTFNVNRSFYVTLISRLHYFEIQIHQHSRPRVKISLSATLSDIKLTIVKTLQAVISKMKYKPYAEGTYSVTSMGQSFDLAFACSLGDSHDDHLMKVVEDADGRYGECLKEEQDTVLTEEHLKWFGEGEDVIIDSAIQSVLRHSTTMAQPGLLTISDLSKVQNKIWEARTQWKNIGLELEIDPGSLDAIELDNPGKSDHCFREMLSQWLRRNPRPTWGALAEALSSHSVGYDHLAQEILNEN